MLSLIREMEGPWLISTHWDCLKLMHLVPEGGRGSGDGKEGMGGGEEGAVMRATTGSISPAGPTLPGISS